MRFTKLHASIVASSIWSEPPVTCKVWITMLAMAGWDGVVAASVNGLAHLARVSIPECEDALAKLSGPDPYSRDGTTGERIKKVEGGWLILNHNRYRDMRSPKQVKDAAYMREYRSRQEGSYSKESKSYTSCLISSQSPLSGSGEEREHEREEAKPKRSRKPKMDPALFDRFWDAYQYRVGRAKAEKAWATHIGNDSALAEQVIEAARSYADNPKVKKDDRAFQKHASTWLNGKHWNDEIPGVKPVKTGPAKMTDDDYADSVQEYREADAEFRAEIRRGHVENLGHKNLRESERKWLHDFIGFMDQIDREDPR